jgi:enoyl-CoA hydratase
MSYTTLLYQVDGPLARVTLNRPERLNAIDRRMPGEIAEALAEANADPSVRVVVLRGAGRAFCSGYDLDWATREANEALEREKGVWDPVADYRMMSANVRAYMALWESPKPVVAGIHGWCLGGGTDLALCADQIVATDDAKIGYPPSRIWGTPTTALWVYRLGPERAKRLLLTGDTIDGREAARIGLVGKAVPPERLEEEVDGLARRIALLPANQLAMLKLLVNQTFENMGLRTTQILGTWFDGAARHTPEALEWLSIARREGFREAVRRRDAPFGASPARSGEETPEGGREGSAT